MNLAYTQPFESSRISTRQGSLNLQVSPPSELRVNLDQFHSDIGFKNPMQLKSFLEQKSRGSVSQGISQKVGEGNQYLNQPQSATVSRAKSAGIYSVSAPMGQGRQKPRVSFTPVGEVNSNFSRSEVNVSANPRASIDFDFQPPAFNVRRNSSLRISVVPYEVAEVRFDRRV